MENSIPVVTCYLQDSSREMGSGHGGMGGMKVVANMRAAMDGGEGAEQMALVATYFAPT